MDNTDRIEKEVWLRAPKRRVWRALTNAAEFGAWFKVALEGDFVVGERLQGKITYPGYEHLTMELVVERMDEEVFFSFRWDHNDLVPDGDPETSTTLVEFRLEAVDEGTRLTVVESGFDRLPAAYRATAFRRNVDGWNEQMENIRRYVAP